MFAGLCSGKLPKLFQRIADSLGMRQSLPPSAARASRDRSEPQHPSRPWNLSQIGHLLTAVFYAGLTGRFSRLLEALDIEHEYVEDVKKLFESEFGFFDMVNKKESAANLIPEAYTEPGKVTVSAGHAAFDKFFIHKDGAHEDKHAPKAMLKHILGRVVEVPPQLLSEGNSNQVKKKGKKETANDKHAQSYKDLQEYLRHKLVYDAKNITKCLLLVYKAGALNMSPPPVVTNTGSDKKQLKLNLGFGVFSSDRDAGFDVQIEHAKEDKEHEDHEFMSNVDWADMESAETFDDWRTVYLLAAQLIKTCITKFTDSGANTCREVVMTHRGSAQEKESIATLCFREKAQDGNGAGSPKKILERRLLNGKNAGEQNGGANMHRIYKILQTADNLTFSPVDAFGESVGGHIFSLLWNDEPGTGHGNFLDQALRLIHLPANVGPTLLAIASCQKNHPSLLPRLETNFSPKMSGRTPMEEGYVAEGTADNGRPPRVKTDSSGTPMFAVRIPPPVEALFREIDVRGHEQLESLYQLIRVGMGDVAFIDLNEHSVATKLKVKAEKCYGLCAGSYMQGSDPFSRPDMNRIVRCVQRLSQDLGLNDQLVGMVVAAAAGNIDSLRSLGIYTATGVLAGAEQSKKPSLEMVKRRGLIRGLCGVITGEVNGELLQFCRLAPDGERYNTNIDMLCYELLHGVVPEGKLREHANHLRCVTGLALSDGLLLGAVRTPVFELLPKNCVHSRKTRLSFLMPKANGAGANEISEYYEYDGDDNQPFVAIGEQFEQLVVSAGTRRKTPYLAMFEGIMDLRLPPDTLEKRIAAGDSPLTNASESWMADVVGEPLWGGAPFRALVAKIVLTFSGSSVALQKRHGLVGLMNVLRPDHVPDPDGTGYDNYCCHATCPSREHEFNEGELCGGHQLPTEYAGVARVSTWELLERMAADKIGRQNEDKIETWSFIWLMRHCYQGGIKTVKPRDRQDGEVEFKEKGTASNVALKPRAVSSIRGVGRGVGARMLVDVTRFEGTRRTTFFCVAAGYGYTTGDTLEVHTEQSKSLAEGEKPAPLLVDVETTSKLALSPTLLECMLHLVSGNWSKQHGIENDLVCSQLNVDPPRAVRQNVNRPPRETPGWKLLRKANSRTLPKLVVGGGRRPLLALRRLRAFINIGTRTLDRVPSAAHISPLKSMGETRELRRTSSINTEIFAMYEGTCIGVAYKVAILALVHVLDHDMDGLEGLWKASPGLVTTVFGQLIKRAINSANADKLLKKTKADADKLLNPATDRADAQTDGSQDTADIKDVAETPQVAEEKKQRAKWTIVHLLIEHVLGEYNFDKGFVDDDMLKKRQETLRTMFKTRMPVWGKLVEDLDPADPESAVAVLVGETLDRTAANGKDTTEDGGATNTDGAIITPLCWTRKNGTTGAFELMGERGCMLLTEMLKSAQDLHDTPGRAADKVDTPATVASKCKSLVDALITPSGEINATKKAFVLLLDHAVTVMQIRTGHVLDKVLETVVKDFKDWIHTETDLGGRAKAFPQKETIGKLLACAEVAGNAEDKDADDRCALPQLNDEKFWSAVAGIFLEMRDPPRTDATLKEKQDWRVKLSDMLCAACALQVETGLLYHAIDDNDRAVMDEICVLREFVLGQTGSMSVRERTDWYREFVTQKLEESSSSANLAPEAIQGKPKASRLNRLLGCAMFLFDLWTWSPDDTDGKQLQQSMFRLRILLKDAVQLAIQLKYKTRSALKRDTREKEEDKQNKIAIAHLLVDVAFHIPRAIAGPQMEAWDMETSAWRERLTLDWNKIPIRILTAAAPLVEMIEKKQGIQKGTGCSSLVEVLRTLRQARNDFGPMVGLAKGLAQGLAGLADETSGRTEAEDSGHASDGVHVAAATPGGISNPADVANIMGCLHRLLNARQVVAPWKAARCKMLVDALVGGKAEDRPNVGEFLTELSVHLRLKTPSLNANSFIEDNIDDTELKTMLTNMLVSGNVILNTVLKFLCHPLVGLIPMQFDGTDALKELCAKEASLMVARVPHVTLDLVIAQASASHLDLNHAPHNLYGVKNIDPVSLALPSGHRGSTPYPADDFQQVCAPIIYANATVIFYRMPFVRLAGCACWFGTHIRNPLCTVVACLLVHTCVTLGILALQ